MRRNIDELSAFVVEGDVVILHDPQTAGIAEYLSDAGIPVVWRCHVGVDGSNEWTEDAWAVPSSLPRALRRCLRLHPSRVRA